MGLIPVEYQDKTDNNKLGYPQPHADMPMEALIFEIVGTFILTFMVFALAVDKRAPKHIYGIGIGGALGVSILAFGKVSGAALNPCRWLGPAILMGDVSKIWLYFIGPITGACMAGALYQWVLMKPEDERIVQKAADFD